MKIILKCSNVWGTSPLISRLGEASPVTYFRRPWAAVSIYKIGWGGGAEGQEGQEGLPAQGPPDVHTRT